MKTYEIQKFLEDVDGIYNKAKDIAKQLDLAQTCLQKIHDTVTADNVSGFTVSHPDLDRVKVRNIRAYAETALSLLLNDRSK